MKCVACVVMIVACATRSTTAQETPFAEEVTQWRATREEKLKAANGWLSLVGRYPLREGSTSFGTGKENDVVFPAALTGTGPDRLGTLIVDAQAKTVTLRLAEGVTMRSVSDGQPFTGERRLGTATDKRDWVQLERLALHVIHRDGKFILRLADNESPNRTQFPGCQWYPPDESYRVEARFVPYPAGKTLSIVNIIDEVSQQPCAGYAEFELHGATHRLDAIREGDGLFFVFRDATAGDTTYGSARFIDIDKQPAANATFILDFNKAYNPPCAFSEYTTCPLPPRQNILKIRIEAGEKFQKAQ
ncbi:MAG: DUF1684 domain-containing protein [Planctomycetes bacterium]|nr:DUF1684 domain-containing protein [Planctomycetota bacterium]